MRATVRIEFNVACTSSPFTSSLRLNRAAIDPCEPHPLWQKNTLLSRIRRLDPETVQDLLECNVDTWRDLLGDKSSSWPVHAYKMAARYVIN